TKPGEKDLRSRYSCRGRIAPGGSRSSVCHPTRIQRSLPARPAAPVLTSERTTACEAPGLSSPPHRPPMQNRKATRMKPWQDLTHYAGFDWAKDHHAVVIVNREGRIVADFEFEHSLEGWKSFADKPRPGPTWRWPSKPARELRSISSCNS